VSQYVVVSPEGKHFGPTDFQTLAQWAKEGRVLPGMTVEDLLSGQAMLASAVPGLSFEEVVEPAQPTQVFAPTRNTGLASLILGVLGLGAWCIPFIGMPVGTAAIVLGLRALQTPDRIKALVGIVLGGFCVLLSVVWLLILQRLFQST